MHAYTLSEYPSIANHIITSKQHKMVIAETKLSSFTLDLLTIQSILASISQYLIYGIPLIECVEKMINYHDECSDSGVNDEICHVSYQIRCEANVA
uniref:Uncharacterized protein n=1 Tax=Cucumis melo TaxID=3656 RepID=A0A9I9E8Y1_CUCME